MSNMELTGIERQLVLQYLMDGNVPVTVTLHEEQNKGDNPDLLPVVFPVAIEAEQIVVSDKGIILLKNPPHSVQGFAGKHVKVEFYFHRLGLYFITEMRESSYGLALVIPDAIQRIQDDNTASVTYDFTAAIYYSCQNKSNVNFECVPANGYKLFSRPVWSSIAVENQPQTKQLLEKFVAEAKKEKNAGNGIQLIPICRFLVEKDAPVFESLEGRVKPFGILFVDHERIVLAENQQAPSLVLGEEYAVKMSFRIQDSPIFSRDIFATCAVIKIYSSDGSGKNVADCTFTSIQEEDIRFLYEKATSKLFI